MNHGRTAFAASPLTRSWLYASLVRVPLVRVSLVVGCLVDTLNFSPKFSGLNSQSCRMVLFVALLAILSLQCRLQCSFQCPLQFSLLSTRCPQSGLSTGLLRGMSAFKFTNRESMKTFHNFPIFHRLRLAAFSMNIFIC